MQDSVVSEIGIRLNIFNHSPDIKSGTLLPLVKWELSLLIEEYE
ncbi:hypothetical protein J2X61_001360 [Bacillus sp. 3255]|nr:hypothetical protein [Bacillus sp. 3255]